MCVIMAAANAVAFAAAVFIFAAISRHDFHQRGFVLTFFDIISGFCQVLRFFLSCRTLFIADAARFIENLSILAVVF